jgi:hypothetical protein
MNLWGKTAYIFADLQSKMSISGMLGLQSRKKNFCLGAPNLKLFLKKFRRFENRPIYK